MAEKTNTASLLTELGVEDLYGFLGVQPDGTEKEVILTHPSEHLTRFYGLNLSNTLSLSLLRERGRESLACEVY